MAKNQIKYEKNIEAIDIFCGIGGLTNGLKKAGIDVKAGIDSDISCKYAYETNNGAKFIGEDIAKIKGSDLNKLWNKNNIKILVGCAPCQPFSMYANTIKEDRTKEEKWNLLNEFLRLVEETKPNILSMENVPNLANQEIFKMFVKKLRELKYYISYGNVFCPDYGIPQNRKRLVLLASRYGEINFIPPTHRPENYVTVKDAIGMLPAIESGETCKTDPLHKARSLTPLNLKRIKATPYGGGWKDWSENLKLSCHKRKSGVTFGSVYGRMKWENPAPTMTTLCIGLGNGRFGHPIQDRAISLREAALLQTFPMEYVFFPPQEQEYITKVSRHIGNAVPPKLGEVIAMSILNHLKEYKL